MTVGILQNNMDPEDKIEAYACDVTYGTNSEFGFDYLRDNMAQSIEEKVQHGGRIAEDGKPLAMHYFAIVDEVDNILIDEARTPLIISGAARGRRRPLRQVRQARQGDDARARRPRAWTRGRARTSSPTSTSSSTRSTRPSRSPSRASPKAEKFLGIDHLYRAENGPLVNHLIQCAEGRVAVQARRRLRGRRRRGQDHRRVHRSHPRRPSLVGGPAPGRRGQGGRAPSRRRTRPSRRSRCQNFFRMYSKLAGMTGTALTEATEFMKIYKLPVVQIPTNQPMVREDRNDQVYKTRDGKWTALLSEIQDAPRARPAGAGRHDLRRGLRDALAPARQARASRTRSSTPSPSTPRARARSSPRPAVPAR